MPDTTDIRGKRVAFLATDGVEQSELLEPRRALERAGAVCDLIAPSETLEPGVVRAWDMTDWGEKIEITKALEQAAADDYDALVLPGGVMNPDKLRMREEAVAFVRAFVEAGKPVSAICHGPWVLIDAGAVKGRTLTSYPSLKADLRNAGANWVDREVVTDRGLTTSRNPDDIPAFIAKTIEEIAEGIQKLHQAA